MVPIAVRVEKKLGLMFTKLSKRCDQNTQNVWWYEIGRRKTASKKNSAHVFLSFIDTDCYG